MPQDEFDALYPNTSKERSEKDNNYRMQVDFSDMSEEAVDEMEDVPAYKRKRIKMKKERIRPDISSFTMSPGADKSEIEFRDNKYLHDKAD